jgi:hypothetical protein
MFVGATTSRAVSVENADLKNGNRTWGVHLLYPWQSVFHCGDNAFHNSTSPTCRLSARSSTAVGDSLIIPSWWSISASTRARMIS